MTAPDLALRIAASGLALLAGILVAVYFAPELEALRRRVRGLL